MRTRWMTALFATGLVFGQPRVQITEFERIIPISGDRISAILDRLPELRLGSLSDTAARAMLDASAIGSTRFLRWHLENLIGATTLTEHETDILVAHWAGTGNDSAGAEVWIWDDAISCYFFRSFAPKP